MSEEDYLKKKPILKSVLTSDEDDIRFRLYSGEIPMWEAGKARFEYMWRKAESKIYWQTLARVREELREEFRMRLDNLERKETMGELISLEGKRLGTGNKIIGGDEWLTKLKVGTIFVCELNQDAGLGTIVQSEYVLAEKDEGTVLLMANIGEETYNRVNPVRFCKYYNLVNIKFEPEEEQPNADY